MFITWIQLAASLLVTEIRSSKVAAFWYGVPLPVVATNWAQQGVLRGLQTPALHRAFTRRKTGLKQWYFGSSWKTESLLLQQHGGGEPLPSNSALWAGTGVVMGTCVPIPRGGWEHPMPWQSCWSRRAPAHQAPTARSKAVLLLLLWTYCVFCKLKKKKKNRLSNEPAQESLRIAFKSITTSPTAEFPLNLNPVE